MIETQILRHLDARNLRVVYSDPRGIGYWGT